MLPFVYVAFAATPMFPAIIVIEMLLLAAYFAAAIDLKPLLLMENVAAYLGRGHVVW